jgi:hypothetical protein
MLGGMTMAHGFEVAAPGTPVDGEGWHMPPAGLEIRFAVGRPPETGGFAVRCGGVLLATGQREAIDGPGPPLAPGVVIMAARHLDPGEGRITAGHRLDGDDIAALRTLLWFAAGIGEDGASRRGPVRDGAGVANALASAPIGAGPCLCGRQLYTVVTQALSHQDGSPPCAAPLPPLLDAETVADLGEDGTALAYTARGTRPRTGGRGAASSPGGGGGDSGGPWPADMPEWERDLLARQAAEAAGGAPEGGGG